MDCSRVEEDLHFPQIRTNRHFRIKSHSRERILMGGELLTTRGKRKSVDEGKRVFSENKGRKSSVESCIKIRITKEEIQRKFNQKASVKKISYESVKTDEDHHSEEVKFVLSHLKTLNHDNEPRPSGKAQGGAAGQKTNESQAQENRFKKVQRGQKQGKGKYRCRVNQFIFDHSRKKSIHKEQQETINQFWKNVNESLILGGEPEEISKDLREFVQHFPTE